MVKKKMNRKIFLILPLLVFVLIFASTVTATTSLTYDYDANGNLISGEGKYYEYNDANQLVRVKYGDVNGPVLAGYVYDYTGQRIKKVENGVTTYYIGKHFETQTDGSNTQNPSYYFANGERVAKKDALGNMAYYHSDHLGGTNVVTDSSGNLVERIKYYPFGEIREGGNEKYSFTGKEKDKQTDFYYFEARYYNPEFKHFTQAGTVIQNLYDPQNLNRYSYVRNNPINTIDPSGHFSLSQVIKDTYETAKEKASSVVHWLGREIHTHTSTSNNVSRKSEGSGNTSKENKEVGTAFETELHVAKKTGAAATTALDLSDKYRWANNAMPFKAAQKGISLYNFYKSATEEGVKAESRTRTNIDILSSGSSSPEEVERASRRFYFNLYVEPGARMVESGIGVVY